MVIKHFELYGSIQAVVRWLPDSCSYDLAMRLGNDMFVNLFHIIQEDRRAFVTAESIYATLSEVRY